MAFSFKDIFKSSANLTTALNVSTSCEFSVQPRAKIFASNFNNFHGRLRKCENCAPQRYREKKVSTLTNIVQFTFLPSFSPHHSSRTL